mmetsp:Transcript_99062/g.159740  ORF Transcript_99062/g.159740 Transcript_99062/m.159740 type:complete len:226 (-) Transcript_99062:634-1311(-)
MAAFLLDLLLLLLCAGIEGISTSGRSKSGRCSPAPGRLKPPDNGTFVFAGAGAKFLQETFLETSCAARICGGTAAPTALEESLCFCTLTGLLAVLLVSCSGVTNCSKYFSTFSGFVVAAADGRLVSADFAASIARSLFSNSSRSRFTRLNSSCITSSAVPLLALIGKLPDMPEPANETLRSPGAPSIMPPRDDGPLPIAGGGGEGLANDDGMASWSGPTISPGLI